MSNGQEGTRRAGRFGAAPQTRLGQAATRLAAAFFVLFTLWLIYVGVTPKERPTFLSDPVHAVLILAAAAAAVAGGIVGTLALVVKGERSVITVLSVLVGAFVLYWTTAELVGH